MLDKAPQQRSRSSSVQIHFLRFRFTSQLGGPWQGHILPSRFPTNRGPTCYSHQYAPPWNA